ncbi:MAG: hypothetical protein IT326_02435 [Anaerolineae bacterium]|nr:hypothetical protein [Anaerolineae bacterium]
MVDQTEPVEKTDSPNGTLRRGMRPASARPIELSENARTVLTRRYLRRGPDGEPAETIDEMFWRVAWYVAEPEDSHGGDRQAVAESYYDLLTSKRFFPNSPTFTGAGTPLGQLAACFVLAIDDDMGRSDDGIFQTLRNAALIQQTGGGNGFSFSRLRPRGDFVASSGGKATGPLGFLRVYDQAFGEVAQGGVRRGANMAVLQVDHPDIREFITCKVSESHITNFNISVGVTDKFMQAVKDNTDFDLINPHDGSVWETVRARDIWDLIVRHAHHNGEPGVLFLDAANRDNPVPHLYRLEATNPCLVGDTRIATEYGLLRIEDLANGGLAPFIAADDRAPQDDGAAPGAARGVALRPATPAWMTRPQAPVMTLITRQGYHVTATPDHRFLTPSGYVELKDLKPGDHVLLQSGEGAWSRNAALPNREALRERQVEMALAGDLASGNTVQRADFEAQYSHLPAAWSHGLGMVTGFLVGDGWLSESSNSPVGFVFSDQLVYERLHATLREWFGAGHAHQLGDLWQLTYGRLPFAFFTSLGVLPVKAPFKRVPEAIWAAPRDAVVGFLQGLFTADGTVLVNASKRDCTVRLASSSRGLLEDVQLLLSNFGIVARLYLRRTAGSKAMPDGHGGQKDYHYQPQYELVLGRANRDRFAEVIGFADEARQNRLEAFIASQKRRSATEMFADTVMRVEDAGFADVYDLSQPQTRSMIANGLVAHNCGEQWLGPNENCCLGSVNLAQHVTADGRVDWEKLRESVELAARFLDDVVDANAYVPAVPALQIAAQRVRRIGLGIMGLSDMMYMLGVRYGSEEGQEFASQVMEFVQYHTMRTSVELARERGPFLAIRGSLYDPADLKWEIPQPMVPCRHDWGRPLIEWEGLREGILRYGIRNGAQTTIAPTGTISTVAGVEGYGCEPVFALAYVRYFDDHGTRRQLQYTSPLFEQALIRAGIDEAARQKIIEKVNVTGSVQGMSEVPEALRHTFVVSNDITAEEHVRTQGVMQRFVSNAISKTCNFPAEATVKDVADAFMLGWELGCKGMTVYVAGSRDKVVLETAQTIQAREESKDGKEKPAHTMAQAVPAPAKAAVPAVSQTRPGISTTPAELPLFGNEPKKPRATVLKGYTYRIKTPVGTTFVTVNENGGDQPFEVFLHTSKAGSDTAAVSEAIGRLISFILRLNSPVPPRERLTEIIGQLEGIGGGRSLGLGPNRVRSLPDGIAQVLEKYLHEPVGVMHTHIESNPAAEPTEEAPPTAPAPGQMAFTIGDLCPECGQAAVVNEEGCRKCYACGYSEC